MVLVAVKYPASDSPATENLAYGEEVPTPTLPPKNWAAKLLVAPVFAFMVRPYEFVVEEVSAEAPRYRV